MVIKILEFDSPDNYCVDSLTFVTEKKQFKMVRTYDDEMKFLERLSPCSWRIKKGFVPNMNVMSP